MQHLHLKIIELLSEKGIRKNQICKDLNLPRSNFNRYCRDEFQRIGYKSYFEIVQLFLMRNC